MKKNGKEKRAYHRKQVEPEKRPYVRRSRDMLYMVLAEIPKVDIEHMDSVEVVRLVVSKLNESGRTRLEVVELASPGKLEIREKHK